MSHRVLIRITVRSVRNTFRSVLRGLNDPPCTQIDKPRTMPRKNELEERELPSFLAQLPKAPTAVRLVTDKKPVDKENAVPLAALHKRIGGSLTSDRRGGSACDDTRSNISGSTNDSNRTRSSVSSKLGKKSLPFNVGDMVLRRATQTKFKSGLLPLQPTPQFPHSNAQHFVSLHLIFPAHPSSSVPLLGCHCRKLQAVKCTRAGSAGNIHRQAGRATG